MPRLGALGAKLAAGSTALLAFWAVNTVDGRQWLRRTSSRLRVAQWAGGFAALHAAALAKLAGRRVLGAQPNNPRTALPPAVDLIVTALKTSIVAAPPSVATIQRYLGSGMNSVKVPPSVASVERLVVPSSNGGRRRRPLTAELVRHASVAPATPVVILYLHGGAYCFGSAGSHRGLAAALSKAACAHVVALNYTLAADAAFPAALHDALDAYAWLCSHRCAVLSAAPSDRRVVVGGDSAGGGLTMALLMALSEGARPDNLLEVVERLADSSHDTRGNTPPHAADTPSVGHTQALPPPSCAFCFSGWFDLRCSGPSWSSSAPADYLPSGDLPLLHDCARLYIGAPEEARGRHPAISGSSRGQDTGSSRAGGSGSGSGSGGGSGSGSGSSYSGSGGGSGGGNTWARLGHPLVSPINYVPSRHSPTVSIPPVLLQVGAERTLSDSRRLAAVLQALGVRVTLSEFPGMPHVFQAFTRLLPTARRAIGEVGAFIATHVPAARAPSQSKL